MLHAIEDFSSFDSGVRYAANKSGPACVQAIQAITQYAEAKLNNTNERNNFLKLFRATELSDA